MGRPKTGLDRARSTGADFVMVGDFCSTHLACLMSQFSEVDDQAPTTQPVFAKMTKRFQDVRRRLDDTAGL